MKNNRLFSLRPNIVFTVTPYIIARYLSDIIAPFYALPQHDECRQIKATFSRAHPLVYSSTSSSWKDNKRMSKLSRRNEPVEEKERLESLHSLGERRALVSALRGTKKGISTDEYTRREEEGKRERKRREMQTGSAKRNGKIPLCIGAYA